MSLIIGVIGMVCILAAFIMDEIGTNINRDSKVYQLVNLVGALLLTYYAYVLGSFPFLGLNVVWAFFAAYRLKQLS
jgi:hypothetical protein